jgi:hypothetical protein
MNPLEQGMLVSLLLPLVALPSAHDQTHYCGEAAQMRLLNLPPSEIDSATEITHSSIVYVGDRFAGYLYRTRQGAIYFNMGEVGNSMVKVSPEDQRTVADALNVQAVHGIQPVATQPVPTGAVSIVACY